MYKQIAGVPNLPLHSNPIVWNMGERQCWLCEESAGANIFGISFLQGHFQRKEEERVFRKGLKGRYYARVWGKDSGVGYSIKEEGAGANILQGNFQRKRLKDSRYYASVWVRGSVGC